MTANEFVELCLQYGLIDPAIALEDDEIREALEQGDDNKVERLLEDNF